METETLDKEISRKSALVYLAITASVALIFLIVSNLIGNFTLVARLGGTVWVSFLTLIVSMPLVTSRFKKKRRVITR
jgi:hypothetical protein